MPDLVVDIRNLNVFAAGRSILALESLSIEPGEVVAILGPNGAGKSTLLKAMTGFRHAAADRLKLLDRNVLRLSRRGLSHLRRRVGYLPQLLTAGSETPLTLQEVVAIGRTGRRGLGRRLTRDDFRIVDEWVDRLGLAALADQRFSDCSGGERRKALIAKAMAQQPDVLLLDEPTANLDLAWRETVVAALQEIYEQTHITIVLVCHELEVLPPCCNRVALLIDGRCEAAGKPSEVLNDDRVKRLYGTALHVKQAGQRWTAIPAERGVC